MRVIKANEILELGQFLFWVVTRGSPTSDER